jgi:voltage-gated potassium channel
MVYTVTFIKAFLFGLGYASPILIFLIGLIALIGLSIGSKEKWSRADAIYFAFITATTVGYGDFHPGLGSSKYKAVFIALVGLVMTGIIVAIGIAAAQAAIVEVDQLAEPLSLTPLSRFEIFVATTPCIPR